MIKAKVNTVCVCVLYECVSEGVLRVYECCTVYSSQAWGNLISPKNWRIYKNSILGRRRGCQEAGIVFVWWRCSQATREADDKLTEARPRQIRRRQSPTPRVIRQTTAQMTGRYLSLFLPYSLWMHLTDDKTKRMWQMQMQRQSMKMNEWAECVS